jgi:hypothetical protein
MSVRILDGIGFGRHAVIRDEAATTAPPAAQPASPLKETTVTSFNAFPYIPWGGDNREPLQMIKDIESVGILNSIVHSQARLALGQGVIWAYTKYDKSGAIIIDDIPVIPEIDDFMEDNNHYFHEHAWMDDLIAFNQGVGRFVLNKGRDKIVLFQRDDVSELRCAKMNDGGISEYIYLCAEWDKVAGVDDARVLKVPLLNPNSILQDLRDRAQNGTDSTFAIRMVNPTWNKKYYPRANWQSSNDWVKILMKIPKMKDAMFDHNFRPRYQVTIYKSFWENRFQGDNDDKTWADYTYEEQDGIRQKVYDSIDEHLGGVDNHGKAIFVDGFYDEATGKTYSEIEIKPIEDLIKEGDMLPDSAAGNSEVSFACMYNPSIVGASLPSGPYTNSQGGSNVRESITVQILIHEPERQMICRNYNIINRFNGWDKTYAKDGLRLSPLIPTTILTTLDTGSGTSTGINGGQPAAAPPPKTVAA